MAPASPFLLVLALGQAFATSSNSAGNGTYFQIIQFSDSSCSSFDGVYANIYIYKKFTNPNTGDWTNCIGFVSSQYQGTGAPSAATAIYMFNGTGLQGFAA